MKQPKDKEPEWFVGKWLRVLQEAPCGIGRTVPGDYLFINRKGEVTLKNNEVYSIADPQFRINQGIVELMPENFLPNELNIEKVLYGQKLKEKEKVAEFSIF